MQKKALVATLSMALVLGVAGIVNAATTGSNAHIAAAQPAGSTAYMNPSNVGSFGGLQGTTPQTNQTDSSTAAVTNAPNNQIQNMPGYSQMQTIHGSTSTSTNAPNNLAQNMPGYSQMQAMPMNTPLSTNTPHQQVQNMPGYNHLQSMPVSTPMNGPMINSQSQQVKSGTSSSNQVNTASVTQQSGQYSRGRTMMGSTGRMGR